MVSLYYLHSICCKKALEANLAFLLSISKEPISKENCTWTLFCEVFSHPQTFNLSLLQLFLRLNAWWASGHGYLIIDNCFVHWQRNAAFFLDVLQSYCGLIQKMRRCMEVFTWAMKKSLCRHSTDLLFLYSSPFLAVAAIIFYLGFWLNLLFLLNNWFYGII